MQGRISAQLFIFLLALSAAGCFSERSKVPTVRSPLVPFDELFVLQDTLRLDPTMLIGQVGFLDVSAREEILVTDHVANSVYLFSPSGSYIRSYSALKCLPDNTNFYPWSSRFIGGGRIMTMRFAGGAVVFNADGSCFAQKRALMPYRKFAIVVDFFADLCCPLFFRGVQKGLFFRSFLTCWRPLLEGVSP